MAKRLLILGAHVVLLVACANGSTSQTSAPESGARSEVTGVTIVSRSAAAGGESFGSTGIYELLVGRIDFALDPAAPHNRRIVDLEHAQRGADGRVHFSADLQILRPVDQSRGNGVLLFDIPNRGNGVALGRFNRAPRRLDLLQPGGLGDGLLMRDGYTLVLVGWEADLPAGTPLRLAAPEATLPSGDLEPISVDVITDERRDIAYLSDDPARPGVIYPPADPAGPDATLSVRTLFWNPPVAIPRDRWRFVEDADGVPQIALDGGFEPGRYYRVTYRPTGALVAGVGLAALRDAASAFVTRDDLPVQGRRAYAFGTSQAGRLLRQFLFDGFNVDAQRRRAFDAVWVHIAGAARGSFNEQFATSSLGDPFEPTQFPFSDAEDVDDDGSRGALLSVYRPEHLPRIFYTNTSVEYWGVGRAAALTHTSVDGTRDLPLRENVRIYLLAGTQHGAGPFPPSWTPASQDPLAVRNVLGQMLANPMPHHNVMRALLRALDDWVENGTPPPASRYPRLSDGTLVPAKKVNFPAIPGVGDPRRIVGPGRMVAGSLRPLPFLVPQVDDDGNETGGVLDPEAAVPLATTTGWNFRNRRVGNPADVYMTLGSYIPFPKTSAEARASGDPRRSIEERYQSREAYVARVREAALALIEQRLMLQEDLEPALARAAEHWTFATGAKVGTGQ
jgi:hypothetical protein